MAADITVQYLKHPRTAHWTQPMTRLGTDEYGTWLGMPAGALFRKGDETPIPSPTPMVQLIAPDAWWTLLYNGPAHKYPVYVDVITPAVWKHEHRIEMVDLDLDVVRRADGTVAIIDQDEFEENQVALGYSEEWITQAAEAAEAVAERLRAGAEPFGSRAQRWHDHLTSGAPAPA